MKNVEYIIYLCVMFACKQTFTMNITMTWFKYLSLLI